MCEYEVIIKNGFGYVVRCKHCQCLNIAFGNIALHQYEWELQALEQLTRRYLLAWKQKYTPNVKEIRIDTPMHNFQLLFAYEELQAFQDMLMKAAMILNAKGFIN